MTPRRPINPMDAAEALFKPIKKTVAPPLVRGAVPTGKELVSLKIDRDILEHFQKDGAGWQDRLNDALRAAVKDQL
jgi:uncharacterized protein (DUF4415 family)